MWNVDSVRLEAVLVSVQDSCTVCAKCTIAQKCFGRTRRYSYVTRLKWKLDSVCLEILLILTLARCTVYAECTIGLDVVLDAPNGTPR